VNINWQHYREQETRLRVELPTYPFEHHAVHQQMHEQMSQQEPQVQSESASLSRHPRPNLATAFVAPRNDIEAHIAELWCELFKLEQIGIHDDFFELGGNSLLATSMLAHLQALAGENASLESDPSRAFGIELNMAQIFENRTVAGIAELLAQQESEELELGSI
ncbi:phosphopantetheine-binding protein, partial [Alteromonas sp. a30]|uniref:phosphopantetheine-binding protein n=1 Tax=Alteromonas sp. a30 TaxID=2730917 RepID=UPI00227E01AB